MGLKLFSSLAATTITLGAAMLALKDNDSASAEQIDAANQELETAGIKGAQLVPGATLEELTAKADRVDAAEAAEKKATAALTAETERADKAEAEMERLAQQPGATVTNPRKSEDKNDVEEPTANDHQKTVEALHNKMLGIG